MKKIFNKYKISKFNRFTNGLLFAVISTIALLICITDLSQQSISQAGIILSFTIAIISMFLGLFTMFRNNEVRKEKI
jgi:glycerol uptake facilitator-like aquaporin